MATVVLAEDTVLGRPVALKRLTAAADRRELLRLRREALVGASISHPNLVSVYDVITAEDGDVVIVMEYIHGETLRDALRRQGRLPAPEALRILEGVAAGLDAIHAQGIVHRDVKPSNILLGDAGAVKVADLGVASVADRTRITAAGAIVGSMSYMAPEQLDDAPTTPAIDVYALAAVAFEMLSGQRARREANPAALAHAIATQPPPDLRDAWPAAPQAAAEALRGGMSRSPAARPVSAGELIGQLRAALAPESTAPIAQPAPAELVEAPQQLAGSMPSQLTPRGPAQRRRSPRRALAAALLALVALAVVLAVLLNSAGPRPRAQTGVSANQRSHATGSSSTSEPATGASTTTATATGSARAGGAATPVSAVESFYGLGASHRYSDAWVLADPTFRNQLGGYQSFQAEMAGDRSISFDQARIVSQSNSAATVAVRTTSVRTDATQHCTGTVDLRANGGVGRWLLHTIHINCA